MIAAIHTDEQACTQGAAKQVFGGSIGCFTSREDAETPLIVDYGVIAGERDRFTAPDQITARIADVRYRRPIEPEGASDDCGGHRDTAWGSGAPCLVHVLVGRLHQSWQ